MTEKDIDLSFENDFGLDFDLDEKKPDNKKNQEDKETLIVDNSSNTKEKSDDFDSIGDEFDMDLDSEIKDKNDTSVKNQNSNDISSEGADPELAFLDSIDSGSSGIDDLSNFSTIPDQGQFVGDNVGVTKKSGISDLFEKNKTIVLALGGILLLSIVGVGGYMVYSSNAKKAPVPVVQKPVGAIEFTEESTNTGSNVDSTDSGSVGINTTDVSVNSGTLAVENTNISESGSTSQNVPSETNPTTPKEQEVVKEGTTENIQIVKKDSSDISIPLKSVTEKIVVNSDGSLTREKNTDLEMRNVKDGSIIIDNSQNKLPNILDLTVTGISEGQKFSVIDEIKLEIKGITNSMSIEPSFKTTLNKGAYIVNINLSFYKDSIISAEKGTLSYKNSLPLDFMKSGEKNLYIMVNGVLYKKIQFSIK